MARVRHPNVVTVYGAERIDGRAGLWMEFVEGQTLEEELGRRGPFEAGEVVRIGIDLSRALDAVHRAGLLHRDLKAQNVMRDADGRVLLADFGAGRELTETNGSAGRELAGTPLYLAPEVLEGQPASAASDIYSLGVLLFHLATGSFPVRGRSRRDLREAHARRGQSSVRAIRPNLPAALVGVVERAIDPHPSRRCQHAADLERALQAISHPEPTRVRRMATIAAVIVVLASAAALPTVWWRSAPTTLGGGDSQGSSPRPGGFPDQSTVSIRRVDIPNLLSVGQLSQDGKFLPYSDSYDGGPLKLLEVGTGKTRMLASDPGRQDVVIEDSIVSPDDGDVAYSWEAGQCDCTELRIVDTQGAGNPPRVLVHQDKPGWIAPVDWSPDKADILVWRWTKDLKFQIALVSTEDGTVRVVKAGFEDVFWMHLSPDGRYVAYDYPVAEDNYARDISVVATDGSGDVPLVQASSHDAYPMWTPDSRGVVFASDRSGTLGLGLIVDFKLELAPVAEVVNVEAVVPAVDVHSSASPVVIDQELVHNLPLDRSVVTYVNLAPGVTNNVAFGGMFRGNPFSLDGTSGNDPEYGAPIAAPNANWIDQIQIVSLGANAQYGDYTGSRFNAITRSGSNRFSGLAEYWTTRPNWTGSNRGSLPPDLARQFRPIEVLERWDTSEQVGGPIVRGRLWFFSGLEYYRNSQRPFRFADVLRLPTEPAALTREPKFLVKLTGAPAPRVRVEGYIEYENSKTTNASAGPLVRPEALGIGANPTHMGNARLTWTLNDRTLLEARYGSFRSHFTYDPTPPNSRSGPPGHSDIFTGVSSVNIGSFNDSVRRSGSGNIRLTRYADRFAGKSHEFKVGLEYERSCTVSVSGYPGGAKYFDFNGAPLQVYFCDGSTVRPSHWTTSLFAQDTWEVNDRLTIEPGVRAGFYDSSLPVPGFTLYKTSSISPRLGAAWDLAVDHRTVVRAHYGWYHDPMVNSFYWYLDSNGCSAPTIVANVLGPGQFQEVTRFGGCRGRIDTDPQTKHSYVEEYVFGIERELWARLSLRAQYVRRNFKDSVGYVDTGPTTWTPVGVIDPGPDGTIGTADEITGRDAQRGAGLHVQWTSALERACADLGTAEVLQNRHLASRASRRAPHARDGRAMRLVCAVREVQPEDVDAGGDEGVERRVRVAGGPHGGDDLRVAQQRSCASNRRERKRPAAHLRCWAVSLTAPQRGAPSAAAALGTPSRGLTRIIHERYRLDE